MKGDTKEDPIGTLAELHEVMEDMYKKGIMNRDGVHFSQGFLRVVGDVKGVKEYSEMWFDARRRKKGVVPPSVFQPDFTLEEIEQAQEIAKGSEVI